jgi:CHAD domain-containing protein
LTAPERSEPVRLHARAPIGDVVRVTLARAVEQLLRQDAALRADADPGAVHDARVAVRRLRSDLRTFGSVLDAGWASDLRDALRVPQDGFSGARDADVLLEDAVGRQAALPAADRDAIGAVLGPLRLERTQAYARMRAMLDDPRYRDLLHDLAAAAEQPALAACAAEPACDALGPIVARAWRRLRARVRGRSRRATDAELHAVRIAAKRARYAVEAVAPVAGRRARKLARAIESMQTVLGEQHDAVVARERMRAFAGHPARAFIAGELAALAHLAAQERAARWHDAWRRAKRAYRAFRRAL